MHCTFYKAKFADESKAGQRAASPSCTGELRSPSFSLPSPGKQSWDVCLPRVVAMTTSSITSLSASMSLKQEGREGLRTAEWGEGNNYLALPYPPQPGRKGFPSPSTSSMVNYAAQKGWSLGGGVAGRGWDSASCPGSQGKTDSGSHMLQRGAEESVRKVLPGGWGRGRHRNSTGTGLVGEMTTKPSPPAASVPLFHML